MVTSSRSDIIWDSTSEWDAISEVLSIGIV